MNDIGALKLFLPEVIAELSYVKVRLDEADMNENSVAIKCAIITSHVDHNIVEDVWGRMKAPNEVKILADAVSAIQYACHLTKGMNAGQILSGLKFLEAFRNPDRMMDVICAMRGNDAQQGIEFWRAYKVTKDIGFADLTIEQQTDLKGKEIGEAIDRLRLDRIQQL